MRHAFGALSRVFVFACLFALALLVPLAAHAQDLGVSPGGTLTTGIPWLDKSLAILAAVGAVCSLLSHFVSADSLPGKIVSWMALNFGKNLAAKKLGTVTELQPPRGFARIGTLAILVGATLLIATAAHAQAPAEVVPAQPAADPAPAAPTKPTGGTLGDVAPSDPPPATPTRFGGCNKPGTFCYGPAANLSLVLFNMKTKDFTLGVVPGIGYGATFFANQPYKVGVGFFGNFKGASANSPSSGMGSAVVSFAEYVRIGFAYEVIGGAGTPYLLGSVGANL